MRTRTTSADELYQAPRSWAGRAYPDNLIHCNRLDRGGHVAAWEQPQLFSEEMRAGFRSLRPLSVAGEGEPRDTTTKSSNRR